MKDERKLRKIEYPITLLCIFVLLKSMISLSNIIQGISSIIIPIIMFLSILVILKSDLPINFILIILIISIIIDSLVINENVKFLIIIAISLIYSKIIIEGGIVSIIITNARKKGPKKLKQKEL